MGAYRWLDGGIYGKMGDVLQVDECRFVIFIARFFNIVSTLLTHHVPIACQIIDSRTYSANSKGDT